MTKYYFHIRRSDLFEEDTDGFEFPSADAAYEEAMQAAKEMLAEKVLVGEVIESQCFIITNQEGVVVRELPFRDVLRIE